MMEFLECHSLDEFFSEFIGHHFLVLELDFLQPLLLVLEVVFDGFFLLFEINHFFRGESLTGLDVHMAFPRVKHYGTAVNGKLVGSSLIIMGFVVIFMKIFFE